MNYLIIVVEQKLRQCGRLNINGSIGTTYKLHTLYKDKNVSNIKRKNHFSI